MIHSWTADEPHARQHKLRDVAPALHTPIRLCTPRHVRPRIEEHSVAGRSKDPEQNEGRLAECRVIDKVLTVRRDTCRDVRSKG